MEPCVSVAIDERDGLRLLRQTAFPAQHAFSTRQGGVSVARFASLNLGPKTGDDPACVRENRRRLVAAAGLTEALFFAPRQTHSADVTAVHVDNAVSTDRVVPGDAVITDAPGAALMILAADCVPVLLFDERRGVIGAVHAGWRGTAGAIVTRAVQAMADEFGCRPLDIQATLGPAIGRSCYEVGPEVVEAIDAATPGGTEGLIEPLAGGKAMIDLVAANVRQLAGAGIDDERIATSGLCTGCRTDLFYSHRIEGPTGRNAALIALPV